jgi:nicotinate-nucleotide adenylyltransferase
MATSTKKIGFLGGSFNPIHYGHLFIASEIQIKLSLDKIFFMPTGFPPHKNRKDILDIKKRIKMIDLAIKNDRRFKISDLEITEKKKSYSIETLRKIKGKYNLSGKQIVFIIGMDSFLDLPGWKDADTLLEMCSFAVVPRPGYILRECCKYKNRCVFLDGPNMGISSSEIRRRIKCKEKITYLVPEKVEQYIIKNKLYQS